jgi:dephospho-CoA kinase
LKKIGLTGGIGSGKSYVSRIFQALLVPVFYADNEAKQILNEPDVLKAVSEALDTNIIDRNSNLADRKKIAELVFNAPDKLNLLNQIIHPKVEHRFIDFCKKYQSEKYVIKEAAILFESGSYKNLEGIICVVSPLDLRLKRVAERDHQIEAEILKRINNQWTDEERVARSNWVIHNNENDKLLCQVLAIHQEISEN